MGDLVDTVDMEDTDKMEDIASLRFFRYSSNATCDSRVPVIYIFRTAILKANEPDSRRNMLYLQLLGLVPAIRPSRAKTAYKIPIACPS